MSPDLGIDELIDEGRFREAIEKLTARVAINPNDDERLFLNQLRAIVGQPFEAWSADWQRVITIDRERRAGRTPDNASQFPPGSMLEALGRANQALIGGDSDAAIDAFDLAESRAAELRGTIDGEPFTGLRDCHDPTAFVIEWIEGDQYRWIPLQEIRSLAIDDPMDPVEMILNPATVTFTDGRTCRGYLPMVYAPARSASPSRFDGEAADEAIEIGQATDFGEGCGLTLARGRRVWQIEDQEVDLASIRQIEFETPGRVPLM
jgi:type VI secretion system protein ImpE